MKNQWTKITVLVLGLGLLWWLFLYPGCNSDFDTKPYEQKIDSLENRIDSIKLQNDSLESNIQYLEETNTLLTDRIDGLKDKIGGLKDELKDAEQALVYTPTQVDSFFMAAYPVQFTNTSQDTTHLPLEVSKQVVVDVKQLIVSKDIIKTQDNTIQTLDTLVKNKDLVIVDLRKKEQNYIAIDKERVEQANNYKIQIDGLKADIRKKNLKLKFGKLEKVIIGVAGLVAGILIK